MKKSLIMSTFFLVLLSVGCSAGPQGQPGPQGTPGQDAQRDRDRNANNGPCPAGEHQASDHDGRPVCVRD